MIPVDRDGPVAGAGPQAGVSIIIPAYNYAKYIREAIDSALVQTYSPIEVVVVDDGSTDNTAEVVKSYSDPRVRYIYQTNAGLSASRNTGIRHARYPFVSFLDADDKLMPEMCERIMETFAKLPSSFALIGCAMTRMDPNGTPIPNRRFDTRPSRELFAKDFILKNRFPCNVIARKEIFGDEQCGFFDTTLTSSEDRDMWIRISTKHRVYIYGDPLVLIRRHPTSMSKNSDRMKLNMRRVLMKAWRARALTALHPFWLKVLAFNNVEVAWMCYDQGRYAKAAYHMIASFLLWPVYPDPHDVGYPPLFRIRGLARFVLKAVSPRPPAGALASAVH